MQHYQQQPSQPHSPQHAYPSALQAGLSPTPLSPGSYAQAFGGVMAPAAAGAAGSAGTQRPLQLTPDLPADEQAWLRFVRNHALLPHDGGSTAALGKFLQSSASSASFDQSFELPKSPGAGGAGGGGKSVGFALLLNRVSGVRIPPHVEAKESRSNLRFRVQISLFDTESKSFFGRTWSSALQALPSSSSGGAGAPCIGQQVLYFRHGLQSEYCLAVVEYVLCVVRREPGLAGGAGGGGGGGAAPSRRSTPTPGPAGPSSSASSSSDEVIVERYGVGWTILNLFGRDRATLGDINHPAVDLRSQAEDLAAASSAESLSESALAINYTPAQIATAQAARLTRRVLTRQLWAGSPRALLFMDKVNVSSPQAMSDFSRQLTKAVGTQLVAGGQQDRRGSSTSAPAPTSGACQLSYELFLCRSLGPLFHLFREHEFLGPADVLAGLPLSPATNSMGLDLDGSGGTGGAKRSLTRGATLPQNPRLLPEISAALPRCQLRLVAPAVALSPGFEEKMLRAIANVNAVQWCLDGAGGAGATGALGVGAAAIAGGGVLAGGGLVLGGGLSSPGALASLDRRLPQVLQRTLVVGVHNGRKYIKTPLRLPLETASPSNDGAAGTGSLASAATVAGSTDGDENASATLLRFQGEFSLSDLVCDLGGDPAMCLTFELQYELAWARPGTGGARVGHANSSSTVLTVAWSVAVLGGMRSRLALDGTPQSLVLQRGPGRTLTNARVYGFADEAEERARKHPGSLVVLTVALLSSSSSSSSSGGAAGTAAPTPASGRVAQRQLHSPASAPQLLSPSAQQRQMQQQQQQQQQSQQQQRPPLWVTPPELFVPASPQHAISPSHQQAQQQQQAQQAQQWQQPYASPTSPVQLLRQFSQQQQLQQQQVQQQQPQMQVQQEWQQQPQPLSPQHQFHAQQQQQQPQFQRQQSYPQQQQQQQQLQPQQLFQHQSPQPYSQQMSPSHLQQQQQYQQQQQMQQQQQQYAAAPYGGGGVSGDGRPFARAQDFSPVPLVQTPSPARATAASSRPRKRVNRPARLKVKQGGGVTLESSMRPSSLRQEPQWDQAQTQSQAQRSMRGTKDLVASGGRFGSPSASGRGAHASPSPIHRSEILAASLRGALAQSPSAQGHSLGDDGDLTPRRLAQLSTEARRRHDEEMAARAANLRALRQERERHKDEHIAELLLRSAGASAGGSGRDGRFAQTMPPSLFSNHHASSDSALQAHPHPYASMSLSRGPFSATSQPYNPLPFAATATPLPSRQPRVVSNVFSVVVGLGQSSRKAFDFENAHPTLARRFVLSSSAPQRVKLREELLDIPPKAVRPVHLVIAPQNFIGTETVFVFIDDDRGNNEECLQFNIQYTD